MPETRQGGPVAIDAAIDELQGSGRLAGATLYAFGHTAATEHLRRRLEHHGRALAAVLDNNPAKQGGSLTGVPILAPHAVVGDGSRSAVLVASRFHDEMRRQLVALGYRGEILRVGTDSITTDTGAGQDSDAGARLLASIRRRDPGRHLVICPFGALGDVYWALAYLPAFAATHGLGETALAVVGEGCGQVARMFGHDHVHRLTQAEMDDLVAGVVTARAAAVTIAHHDRPYGEAAPVRVLDDRFVAFTDLYRDLVYGLGAGSPPRAPQPDGLRRFHPDPWELPRGRTVLIAPYAKSVMPVAWSYWVSLAERHRAQGSAVATVVHGDEQPVPGTVSLELPLRELHDAVEYAGTFIGLRSGLCDVVHAARARKVSVCTDAPYSTTAHRAADFFALPGWESVVLPGG